MYTPRCINDRCHLPSQSMNKEFKGKKTELDTFGYTKLEGVIPLDTVLIPLWKDIHEVARLIAAQLGERLDHFIDPSISAATYLSIAKRDRSFISRLYDQCKQLPSFLRLACWDGFEKKYSIFLQTNCVGVGENSYGVRFNLPNEEKFRSHWHQGYAYNPQSSDGLVFWVPLVDIMPGMGAVEILSGSHRLGIVEHREVEKYSHKTGLYRVGIPNEDEVLSNFNIDRPTSSLGDLLLMRFDTVHQSGKNISNKLRVTFQVRYFNFKNSEAARMGWPSRPSAVFGYDVQGKK